jgi:RHS repeat-associated protein
MRRAVWRHQFDARTGNDALTPLGGAMSIKLFRWFSSMLLLAAFAAPASAERFWYHDVNARQTPEATASAACVAGGQLILAQTRQQNPSSQFRIQVLTAQAIDPDFEYLCKVTIQRRSIGWLPFLVEQPYNAFAAGSTCPVSGLADGNGYCCPKCDPGGCGGGPGGGGGAGGTGTSGSNPIDGASGNKFEWQSDYRGAGWMPLVWSRAYNHLSFERGALGVNWKHRYERRVAVTAFTIGSSVIVPTAVKIYREDGRRYDFSASGANWTPAEADINHRLDRVVDETGTAGWRLRTPDNHFEVYDAQGQLTAIVRMDGPRLALSYDSAFRLATVTDDFGRALTLAYDAQSRIAAVIRPDGRNVGYAFDASNNLQTASYPEGAGTVSRIHRYNEPTHVAVGMPNALTGIEDEAGKRYATFKYDAQQRASLSTHAGGAMSNAFTYNADGSATVVDALGTSRNFGYSNILGRRVVTGVSQPCTACGGSVAQSLAYDANGNATSSTDFNGNKICRAFDSARNLTTVTVEGVPTATACSAVTPDGATLPAGARKTRWTWHPDWRVPIRASEPRRITTWVYNGQPDPFNGNAIASCAPTDALLPDGKPIAVLCKRVEQSTTDATGAQGLAATIGNGVAGNATPAVRTWAYTYHRFGQMLTMDGPRTDVADTTTYEYYADTTANWRTGDLKQVTNALGHIVRFTQYNAHGQVLQTQDANGVVTAYTYDERQRLKTRTEAFGTGAARTTTFTYDPRGLLAQVDLPAGTASNAAGTGGSPTGRRFTYAYDDAQRLVSVTSATGEQMSYQLDGLGNVRREEVLNATAVGGSASLLRRTFDALGRLASEVRIIDGADRTSVFGYDAQGNLTSLQRPREASYGESTDPTELRRYNALNQLTRIEDAQHGAGKPTVLAPDARDQLAGVQAANAATTSYARDGFDQVLTESGPDRGLVQMTWDAAGNLRTVLDARGVTATHSYDALNRLVATVFTQSGQTSTEDRAYTWDATAAGSALACSNAVGRLCRVVDGAGTTDHAWSVFGTLLSQRTLEAGLAQVMAFGYDAENRLSALVSSGGKAMVLPRDAEGRGASLRAVVNAAVASLVQSTSWRGDGQRDVLLLGNNVRQDRGFDSSGAPAGQVESGVQPPGDNSAEDIPTAPEWALIILGLVLVWQLARAKRVGRTLQSAWPVGVLLLLAVATSAMADEALSFDARGNVKSRTVDGRLSAFGYDRIDRLRSETGAAAQSFGLDENGNRTSDGTATYTVLANGNRLVTRNGVSLTYDAAGNLLSDQAVVAGTLVNRAFTYTLAGQLKTVSVNGALRATYFYNHLSQRTRKVLASPPTGTPGTTLYRYDPNGRLVEEIAGSAASGTGINVTAGQSLVTYAWLDETPSAIVHAASSPANPGNAAERVIYLHTDHLETPRKASDANARIVWSWESDAFGAAAPNEDVDDDTKKVTVNLRFPGQYFDAESGLHYNWHRYYDARSGRYTQSDPIGLAGGANVYGYVGGNPLGYVDPQGLWPLPPSGGGGDEGVEECPLVGMVPLGIVPSPFGHVYRLLCVYNCSLTCPGTSKDIKFYWHYSINVPVCPKFLPRQAPSRR